jgi:nicotinamidase-related amidase
MSHCVNYTLSSIVERWDKDKLNTITLITDAASPVPGFEETGNKFQEDMATVGVLLKKSTELF